MTKEELQIIYSKKIRPVKIFQKALAYLCVGLLLFFIVTAVPRCSGGNFLYNFELKVAKWPLNEIPQNVSRALSPSHNMSARGISPSAGSNTAQGDSWKSVPEQDAWSANNRASSATSAVPRQPSNRHVATQAPSSGTQANRLPRTITPAQDLFWKSMFERYAVKIKIDDPTKYYRIDFKIGGFPLNNRTPSYAELAFEVYNAERDYLFSFYADNYWHQSGYDDGYWHQWNYNESLKLKFPKKGEYYIVCGASGQYQAQIYQIMQNYSGGAVTAYLYEGVKPFSTFPLIFAMIIFSILILIFFTMKMGALPNYLVVGGYLNFNKYNYIVELPSQGDEKNLFQITGYIRTKNVANYRELILTRDGFSTYLEAEKEVESSGDSTKTYYYFYYYDDFPEDAFEQSPDVSTVSYKGKTFFSKSGPKSKTYEYHYANGLNESVKKVVNDFAASKGTEYVTFEYIDDPKEFDVSYGKEIKNLTVWKVAK
jgi:hypothetical protein